MIARTNRTCAVGGFAHWRRLKLARSPVICSNKGQYLDLVFDSRTRDRLEKIWARLKQLKVARALTWDQDLRINRPQASEIRRMSKAISSEAKWQLFYQVCLEYLHQRSFEKMILSRRLEKSMRDVMHRFLFPWTLYARRQFRQRGRALELARACQSSICTVRKYSWVRKKSEYIDEASQLLSSHRAYLISSSPRNFWSTCILPDLLCFQCEFQRFPPR